MSMNDREKMLAFIKMIELVIVPFSGTSFFSESEEEIIPALESLSAEDQRKAKRKFLKLHKKAYKKLGINCNVSKIPSPSEFRRRRAAVRRMILSDLVGQETT